MGKQLAQKIQAGHRYGHWVILSEGMRVGGDIRYLCRCDCGTEKTLSAITLRNGSSTHCGCRKADRDTPCPSHEPTPISPDIQEVLQCIQRGLLPPADQFHSGDGSPSWTLASIARILGVNLEELVDHIQRAGQRFASLPVTSPGEELSLPSQSLKVACVPRSEGVRARW